MAIVLPHGIMFIGVAEGEIRKKLIEKHYIDTITGLPNNLFTNGGTPVVVMILKKNREIDKLEILQATVPNVLDNSLNIDKIKLL